MWTASAGRESKEKKAGRRRTPLGDDDSLPIDGDASRTSRSDTKATFSLALEPPLRSLVISQIGLESFQASAIVILYPLLLIPGKDAILNHLGLNGDTGKPLEAEPTLPVELVFGRDSSDGESGLDTDTPLSRVV